MIVWVQSNQGRLYVGKTLSGSSTFTPCRVDATRYATLEDTQAIARKIGLDAQIEAYNNSF